MTQRACGTTLALMLLSLALPVQGQDLYLYSPTPVSPDDKGQAKDGVLVREIQIQRGDTLSGLSRKYNGRGFYYPQIMLFNDIKNPNLIYTGDTLKVPLGKDRHKKDTGKVHARKAKAALPETEEVKQSEAAEKPARRTRKKSVPSASSQNQPIIVRAAEPTDMDLSLGELKRADKGKEKKKRKDRKKQLKQPAAETCAKPMPTAEAPQAGEVSKAEQLDTTSAQRLYERAVKAYRQEDCNAALELFDRFLAENPSSALAADASLYKAECLLKLSGQ